MATKKLAKKSVNVLRKVPAPPLRIGIIGAGGIAAKMHLPGLEKIKGVTIAALAGRKRSRLEVLQKRHGGEIYTDYKAVIENPKIDAIVIATPHPNHVDLGIATLAAGKHLFMQKPLAPTMAEADRFVDAVERSSKVTYCLPQLTFPALDVIRSLMAKGALGQVTAAHCRVSHGGPEVYYAEVRDLLGEPPLKKGEKLWFFQAGDAAVGALFDMGVYAIARLVAVLGNARRVMGMTAILDKPSQVEDTASLLIQFESGAIATAETGWTDGGRTARLAVHGTFGRCEQDGFFASKVTMFQQASKTREDVPPKKTVIDCSKTPVVDPHLQWIQCIRTGTRPKLETARAARHITEIIMAGLESGRTGRAVEIHSGLD